MTESIIFMRIAPAEKVNIREMVKYIQNNEGPVKTVYLFYTNMGYLDGREVREGKGLEVVFYGNLQTSGFLCEGIEKFFPGTSVVIGEGEILYSV